MSDVEMATALDAYVDALLAGEAPDVERWLEDHPELGDAMREELELVASLHRAAESVAYDSLALDGPEPSKGPASARLLEPGTRLGECVIEELLGSGGMGEVYRARHELLGNDVAIKVLRPALAHEPEAIKRFEGEVRAQAHMSPHPNVATAMHASAHEGRLYLVMEYVEGTSLLKLVRQEGPVAPHRAAELVEHAARGLSHAHAAGIVHRDIKPSNMILTPEGVVKIVDLGLARLGGDDPRISRATWVDELVGSLDYMAPEQADHPDEADARSDLYALGCTLYFLLEGRAPFADRLALKKLMAHAVDPPPPLTRAVPQAIRAILARLLEKDPNLRPDTAGEVALMLAEVRTASAASPQTATAPPPAPESTHPAPMVPSEVPRRWIRTLWLLPLVPMLLLGLYILVAPSPRLSVASPRVGELEEGDAVRPKERSFFDLHPARVEAGTTYVFTLRSRDFDPALVLRGDGWELDAVDDGPGLGWTAQVVFRAEEDADVEVVATSADEDARGSYLLSVETLADPEIALGGAADGVLEDGDRRLHSDGTWLDRYWVRVTAGETYIFQMQGDGFTPFVFLGDDADTMYAVSQADPSNPAAAQLFYVPDVSGVVYLGANAHGVGRGGAYRLSVSTQEAGSEVLNTGGMLTDSDPTLGDESFYDSHAIPVQTGHTYVITMRSEEFDTYLLLVAQDERRLAENDDAMGTDSRIVYTAREDQTLRVFANSFRAGMRGSYVLSVRELPPNAEAVR
ncbi:MAG: serine/threonine-protein kinase [Sandaracinaceae bacterium]